MNIVPMDPKKLIPYEHNAKNHPPEQVQAIARSITEFGFDQPIVVDKDFVVVKGHGRLLAALHLGLNQVPVLVSENPALTDRLNRLADNTLNSRQYDPLTLRMELTALMDKGLLESTLYTADQIPDAAVVTPKTEISLFNLTTNHKCPACSYRW